MNIVELIRRKRDGGTLAPADIATFVRDYTDGNVPDYQASAFLMAAFLRGLDGGELVALTQAMLHSGDVLDLSDIPGAKVDKHSTGGVGDKISLHLAPAVAACGLNVPMISGRGLGHTGGTLDKLESIPGFRTNLSIAEFRSTLRACGMALIGQTDRLAPADKKLYALRDVTGTVESIPLIAASIMSKKLAEGIDGLVLDVKVGSGAFMKTLPEARQLAETLVDIGKRAGKRVSAFLTNMDEPLGRYVGNWLEVAETLDVLGGCGEPDLVELTVALGGEMLVLGQAAATVEEGRERITSVLNNGEALKRFDRCVELQGGNRSGVTAPPLAWPVVATASGYVQSIDAQEIGLAAIELGAGRTLKEDNIAPFAGIFFRKKIGEPVKLGEVLADISGNSTEIAARIQRAFTIDAKPPESKPLIWEVIR